MTDFLPKDEKIPAGGGKYTRFKSGDNKLRILGSAITGYELWVEGKPLRNKTAKEFTADELANADTNTFTNKKKTPQYFWAFVVYNYDTEKVEVCEVTQKKIMYGIEGYLNDEDYGKDPSKYDLVINRDDEADPVSYSVRAKPPKDFDETLKEAKKEADKIKLEALYEGKDPFESEEFEVDEDDIDSIFE